MTSTPRTCPYCGSTVLPRSRFCPTCGRSLVNTQSSPPVEVAVPVSKRITIDNESLNLRELVNVVESGVRWWQQKLASADIATRQQAAGAIEELSQILHSLSQQLAAGRETVRITTRLPALRTYDVGCPVCGGGNRTGAKFCQRCGALLSGTPAKGTHVVPVMPLQFSIAARSDVGRVRKINQDSVYTGTLTLADGTRAQLCLVADGMGGAKAGEQASRIASEVTQVQLQRGVEGQPIPDDTAWHDLLRSAARAANRQVYNESRVHEDQRGMGTTLTVALIVGNRVHLASVGDTRAYLINARGITTDNANVAQLTSDHSLVARLVDIGQITPEQARTHPQRNLLYRSIGTDPSVDIDTRSEQIEVGDVILLCSDGLFSYVRDEELARIAIEQTNLEQACDQLVKLANERGGSDNISVIIIRVEKPEGKSH